MNGAGANAGFERGRVISPCGGVRPVHLGSGVRQRVARFAAWGCAIASCVVSGCGPSHTSQTIAPTRSAPEAEPATAEPSAALAPVSMQASLRNTAILTPTERTLFRARAVVEGEGIEAGSRLGVEAPFRARIREGRVELATEALGGGVAWHRECGDHWLFALDTGDVVVTRGFLGDAIRRHALEATFSWVGGDDTAQMMFAASTGQAFRVPCDGGDLAPAGPVGVHLIEGVWFVGALGIALVDGNALLRTLDGGGHWERLPIDGGAGGVRVEDGRFVVAGVTDEVVVDVATGAQSPYVQASSSSPRRPRPIGDDGAIDYAIFERYPSLYARVLDHPSIVVFDGGAWVAVAHGRSVRVFERGRFQREFTPGDTCRDVSEVWRDREGGVVIDCAGDSLVRVAPDGEATVLASSLRKPSRVDGALVRWQVDPEWRAMARMGRCANDSGGSNEGFVCWLDLRTRSLREIAWPGASPANVVAVRGAHVLAQSSDEAVWVTSDAAPIPVASERGARWILTDQASDGFLWSLQRRGSDVVLVHHHSTRTWAVRPLPVGADIVGFAGANLGVARSSDTGDVHVTRDGGAHWTPLSLPEGANVAPGDDELFRQARAELGPDDARLHHIACADAHTCQWLERWVLAEAGVVPVVPMRAVRASLAPVRAAAATCTMSELTGDTPEEWENVAAHGQVTAWFHRERSTLRAHWQVAAARPVASRVTRLPAGPRPDPWADPEPPDMLSVMVVRGGADWLVAGVCASQCHVVLARPSSPLVYLAHGDPIHPSDVLDVAVVDSRLFVARSSDGGFLVTEFDMRGRVLRERIYSGGMRASAFLGGEGLELALVRVPWDSGRVLIAPLLDDARDPFVVDTTHAPPCEAGASGPLLPLGTTRLRMRTIPRDPLHLREVHRAPQLFRRTGSTWCVAGLGPTSLPFSSAESIGLAPVLTGTRNVMEGRVHFFGASSQVRCTWE